MRRELGGIDHDAGAVTVRDGADLGDRQHLTRHVAGSGERHEDAGVCSFARRVVEDAGDSDADIGVVRCTWS